MPIRDLRICGLLSGAVLADQVLRVRELAAVMHEEAAHAGELVVLPRTHLHRELLVREVRARQLEGLGRLGLVLVDLAGVLVVTARLELFDALLGLVFLVLARCVVISRHPSTHSLNPAVSRVFHASSRPLSARRFCTMARLPRTPDDGRVA